MSFRDFINNRRYRRRLEAALRQYQNITPPANPSRRYMDKLVRRLLDVHKAWAATKELSMIGSAAVPSLAAALADPRYHQAAWPEYSQLPAPLESVLELLVPHGGDHVLAAAMPLISSPSDEVRKTAALQLASLGRVETIPVLARLLQDVDGYVRSYVQTGIDRALSEGRAGESFRRQAYDLLLVQCDQDWAETINDAARTVIALDSRRAAMDFATQRWLSGGNRYVFQILAACNRAGILLPEALTRPLLEHSLPRAAGANCYPHQYVAAAALESIGLRLGEAARPLLQAALTHEHSEIERPRRGGIAELAGLRDPVGFVLERMKAGGFEGLSHSQRVVFCAFNFDAEVCNGGILQFFGNSAGDYAVQTLAALRELGHAQAEAALKSAIERVGPRSLDPARDTRLAAFEGRFDELRATFRPLEDDYYGAQGLLRQKMLLYAAGHAGEFGARVTKA